MDFEKKQRNNIWMYYYSIIFLFYTISLFTDTLKVGVVAAIFMVAIFSDLLRRNLILNYWGDLLVLFYILFCIISILWFPRERLPISVYLTDVSYSALPICFYFIKNSPDENKVFLKKTMKAIYYSLIVGIVLYEWAPEFYGRYLVYHDYSSNTGKGWIQSSLQSFYGVTAMGTFSTIAVLYAFMQIIKENKTKDKILFILSLVTLFLSSRRSAWVAVVVVLVYFHYLVYIKWRKLRAVHFIIEIGVISISLLLMSTAFSEQFNKLIARVDMISSVLDERSSNWTTGLQNINNILIGNGLGAMSHQSSLYGNIGVYDSSYIKTFCELGIIGILMFILILSRAVISGIKNVESCYIELAIVVVFIIQAAGSNVFSFQVLSPIFWYAVGQCTMRNRRV